MAFPQALAVQNTRGTSLLPSFFSAACIVAASAVKALFGMPRAISPRWPYENARE